MGSAIGWVSSKRGTRRPFPRAMQECACGLTAEKPRKCKKRIRRWDRAVSLRAQIQIGACARIGAVTGWVQVLQRGSRRVSHAGQSAAKHHSKNAGEFPCQKCNR